MKPIAPSQKQMCGYAGAAKKCRRSDLVQVVQEGVRVLAPVVLYESVDQWLTN